jgi:type II secretory pathway pseudopilin PulG
MENQQLIDYVRKSRSIGKTDEQIKADLLAAGWAEKDIQEGLVPNINPNNQTKKSNKKLIIGIVIGILISVFLIIGILTAIVLTSLNSAKSKAKLASFRSTSMSVNPGAMACADEASLNTQNPGVGQNICSDVSVYDGKYPSLSMGICDENAYSVSSNDPVKADGKYKFTITCEINGEKKVMTCDQMGCTY